MRKTRYSLVLLLLCLNLFQPECFAEFQVEKEVGGFGNANGTSNLVSTHAAQAFASSSVLGSGKWVKIKVEGQGIFKITYSELKSWGFSDPAGVSVFGNGGYMLSKMVDDPFADDLAQNPVWHGKGAGNEDCLFFYATGTIQWTYYSSVDAFKHQGNDYSDVSFYYLTDKVSPLIINTIPQDAGTVTNQVTEYLNYLLYEDDAENLIESGRQWYGERFQPAQSRSYSFTLPNPVSGKNLNCYVEGAGRSSSASSLSVSYGGSVRGSVSFSAVDTGDAISQYANTGQSRFYISSPSSALNFTLTYNASGSASGAWLDYIELNAYCNLTMTGASMNFRYPGSVGPGMLSRFTVSGLSEGAQVWDVTNYLQAKNVTISISGTQASFNLKTESLREFVAFVPTGAIPGVTKLEDVANQDLHQMDVPEMLIITHPDFRSQADELADFHMTQDGLQVSVAEPGDIYNEFSSGIADVAAIRNFIRCCYERGAGRLKYVLLLGDGSYDNKNILGEGLNFIPTYQSENSLLPTASFVTDDFFVLLDSGEGEYNGLIDLGIGRIPAKTADEAQVVVDKIKNYVSSSALGEWRNIVSFIADDEDSNTHMGQADQLADDLEGKEPASVISKIYFDAFKQETGPGGDRYPDVTTAINNRVKEGALVLNYTGHANESALAAEKILGINDIDAWTNYNRLPVFVTATCEFSRFDGDEQSGGEHILFNPDGGGIGLFSTTRVVYSNPNFVLNSEFYKQLFERDADGRYLRMGDVMKRTKNAVNTGINKRNFMLLGDPALRLAVPEYNVVTRTINGVDPESITTPIGALSKVLVTGEVVDENGSLLPDFNGELIPIVYDKATSTKTLGNGGETPFAYTVRNNRIYKGLCSVVDGKFEFSFIVPKDISYAVGNGKIVYYAHNDSVDAHGATSSFLVGGGSGNTITDNEGPGIGLYLNTPSFNSGDAVGENSILYLDLSDASGINTVGTGIGHDITAVLDGDYSNVIVLNDYYLSDLDSYNSGTVVYPLSGLSVGEHTLTVKVWDVVNNSTELTIHFVVTDDFQIEDVVCYPNPATDYTRFKVIHNRPDEIFDARIELFDTKGSMIDVLNERIYSEGAETTPVVWQISDNQALVRSGAVIYRVVLKESDGTEAGKSGVLIILKK